MSGAVSRAALLVVFPVAAAALGAGLAAWRRPGAKVTSGVQHFAGGVVLAALAGEVLPDLRAQGHLGEVLAGFGLGVVLLLTLGVVSRRTEQAAASRNADREGSGPAALPVGLLAAVAVDLLIDGLLVGIGATLGSKQGVVLTVALTLEILFLGVSVVAELLELGVPRRRAAVLSGSLGLATAAGAIIGAAVLAGAGAAVLAAVLAFGAAALLYLVVEELLVEAHEKPETPLLTAMFFLGFIGLYALAG